MSREIFIGDVHGCFEEFSELLEKLALQPSDRVLLVGDLLDKGPDPAACVRLARQRRFEAVLGNHEDKFLRFLQHERRAAEEARYTNPMRYGNPADLERARELSAADVAWLADLPLAIELGDTVVVHGGLLPGQPLQEQIRSKRTRRLVLRLRWLRNGAHVPLRELDPDADPRSQGLLHWSELYDGPAHVVYGHESHNLSRPHVHRRSDGVATYGIDTGCVYGGRLTALVKSRDGSIEFVQVDARRPYARLLFQREP